MQPTRRDPQALGSLAELSAGDPSALVTVFAAVLSISEGRTKAGRPFFDLRLGDAGRTVAAKIWDDAPEAMQAAAAVAVGQAIKVLGRCETYQGALQVNVRRLRAAEAGEPGFDPAALFGEGHALVAGRRCRTLVVDIETVPGIALADAPEGVAQATRRFAERDGVDTGLVMSLSPMLGKVVSLAFGDGDADPATQEVTVLAVPHPEHPIPAPPPWLVPLGEAELLQAFWALAASAEVVVTYNGRNFDIPFLVGRSLVHGIAARVDLLGNPYALRPHLDLYRVLTGGGRAQGPTGLDVVCWALGIPSPKGGLDGSKVAEAYARGELTAIADYNRGDVRATTAVFQRIRGSILSFRQEW